MSFFVGGSGLLGLLPVKDALSNLCAHGRQCAVDAAA
jgi:hypothetical protein